MPQGQAHRKSLRLADVHVFLGETESLGHISRFATLISDSETCSPFVWFEEKTGRLAGCCFSQPQALAVGRGWF